MYLQKEGSSSPIANGACGGTLNPCPVRLPPEPLVPLMRFLDRHHFENIDNAPGQNIKELSIGMSDMHPAVTVLQ